MDECRDNGRSSQDNYYSPPRSISPSPQNDRDYRLHDRRDDDRDYRFHDDERDYRSQHQSLSEGDLLSHCWLLKKFTLLTQHMQPSVSAGIGIAAASRDDKIQLTLHLT
ncbi:hypothetical protein BHE74_00042339 [Ensete ventricosum]|nr:hypothetical protein GW17_00046755 [Ensete ventricosum]RWW51331.1 hypothetical protein BHE74_00042339 [Ensete ventricosum]RZS19760.1 hypothetical protein BHM03_00052194 [Ensete ventricosum]